MHAHRCVCTGPLVAPVRACAVWGPAPPWHCLPALPICRECPGPGGAGRAGNLSQLLCPVSGKPPAGILPRSEPACPCTCPLGFQEGPRRPCLQPCMTESSGPGHTMQGRVSNPLPPARSEPEETEQSLSRRCKPKHTYTKDHWRQSQLSGGPECCSHPQSAGVGGLQSEHVNLENVALPW